MKIILAADDFGYSLETLNATIDCAEAGALTSASILVNCPESEKALNYAREHPSFGWGVHLTFVGDGVEKSLLPHSELNRLTDSNGYFLPSNKIRLLSIINCLPVDQIAREMSAQISKAIDCGVKVSYVDSHGHLHKFYPFQQALKKVLPYFGIKRVRYVQNVYFRDYIFKPTYLIGQIWRSSIRKNFITTDYLYMPSSTFDKDWAESIIKLPLNGVLEVGG